MSDKLLPCPFCGGEASLYGNEESNQFNVMCHDCETSTSVDNLSGVIKIWNNRTQPNEPVKHGKWIAEQKNAEYCEFICSECDHSIGQTDQYDETEVKQFSEWYSYCPNCGAKMDKESDNNGE